jgi:hypothetical protein
LWLGAARLKSCPYTFALRATKIFTLRPTILHAARQNFSRCAPQFFTLAFPADYLAPDAVFRRRRRDAFSSPFHVADRSVVRGMRLLQVMPQVHIQGDGYAHNHQRAPTQYQKPPDHPHSRLG